MFRPIDDEGARARIDCLRGEVDRERLANKVRRTERRLAGLRRALGSAMITLGARLVDGSSESVLILRVGDDAHL